MGGATSTPSSSLSSRSTPSPSSKLGGGACCSHSARRHQRHAVVTSAHVGDAQWIVQQGVAAGVILGGFVASGGLDQISGEGMGGGEEDEEGRPRGMQDPNETCPMCEGTGKTECACVRWSDDDEGCSSCGYTGIRNCPACRGGGRAVRVTVEIPVENDDQVSVGGGDRSGFSAGAATTTAATAATTMGFGGAPNNTYAFAAPIAMPRAAPGAGVRGDSSLPSPSSSSSSSSPSASSFRFPASLDDDELSGGRELDQDALMRLLGQMSLLSGGKRMPLSSTFVDFIAVEDTADMFYYDDDEDGDVFRDDDVVSAAAAAAHAYGVVAEPPSSSSSGGGGGGGGGGGNGENENNSNGTDPSSSKDDDFYAQSGEAIRTLREDYPLLLQKPLVLGIYRDDIGLIDETLSFGHNEGHVVASGIDQYQRCHKWLRTAAKILFSHSDVQVQRIWSPLGSSGVRTIKVRWSITGRLRLVGNLTEEAHFDGISEYRLDRGGFIYQHTLTDLDWDVAQMRDRIAALSNVLVSSKTPQLGSGQWFRDLVPEGWFK